MHPMENLGSVRKQKKEEEEEEKGEAGMMFHSQSKRVAKRNSILRTHNFHVIKVSEQTEKITLANLQYLCAAPSTTTEISQTRLRFQTETNKNSQELNQSYQKPSQKQN